MRESVLTFLAGILLALLLSLSLAYTPTLQALHLSLENASIIHARALTIHALAVSGQGGEVLNITVIMLHPGDGNVYVATMPLPTGSSGEMFMTSSQLAFYIAAMLAHKNPLNYSFLIKVRGNVLEIGGPSASAYIATAMYALLTNRTLNRTVTMTGMILPGGIVGPVGGVPYKIEAAAEEGYKVVLVPALNYIILSQIPRNVKVVPIIDVRQAIRYLTGKKLVLYNVSLSSLSKMYVIRKLLLLLWTLMKERVSKLNASTLGPAKAKFLEMVKHAEEEAAKGNYYTAASILYKALIYYYNETYRQLVLSRGTYVLETVANNIQSQIQLAERVASQLRPNVLTVDLLVGLYCRIQDAKYFLDQFRNAFAHGAISTAIQYLALAKVRTETLFDWIKAIRMLSNENVPQVSQQSLKFLARIYIQFLKTLIGYLPILRGVLTTENLATKILKVESLYKEGHYLRALSLSFYYIFDITDAIMQGYMIQFTSAATSKEKMLNVLFNSAVELRQAALTELYELTERGYVSLFAFMYTQYGNYYLEKALKATSLSTTINDLAAAMTYYTLALLHDDLVEYFAVTSHVKKLHVILPSKINETTVSKVSNQTQQTNITKETTSLTNYGVKIEPTYLVLGVAIMFAAVIVYSAMLLTSSLSSRSETEK